MRNRNFYKTSIVGLLPLALAVGVLFSVKPLTEKVDAYNGVELPTTINLNDTEESDIRNYYSNLNLLDSSERKGENLLKNLKPILVKNQKYYNYDSGDLVWKMYEITDRDWEKSPASDLGEKYDAQTNTISNYTYESNGSHPNNPYLRAYYMDRSIDNPVRAWGNHNQDGTGINREHLWAKAEGFDGGGAAGARGDPMHLVAANGYANNIHSNYFYGYVDKTKDFKDTKEKYSTVGHNFSGKSKTFPSYTGTVFEPQDCDKGDIARAIFYMAARYNNIAGSKTEEFDADNPNLLLTNDLSKWQSSGYTSTATVPGYMGLIDDLLEWNRIDKPDEYEIHRNNLLFENFTNNRNPFIDFPEWADICFGNSDSSADPQTDSLNGIDQKTPSRISVTTKPSKTTYIEGESFDPKGMVVKASYSDGSTAVIYNYTYSPDRPLLTSDTSITISYLGKTASVKITVNEAPAVINVESVTVSPESKTLEVGDTTNLSVTVLPENATDKTITWSSNNTSVANVDEDGLITTFKAGTAIITAKSNDKNVNISDSCTITVLGNEILDSISIEGTPKTTYTVYDEFTTNGISVLAHFKRGNVETRTEIVTDDCEFSGYDLTVAGKQSVLVTYNEIETSFDITVKNEKFTIEIDTTTKGFEDGERVDEITESGYTVSFIKGQGQSNYCKYYTSGKSIRCYGGNSIKISGDNSITKVVFIYGSGDGTNEISTDVGDFDVNEWVGNSDSVTFTIGGTKGHRRIAKIRITYDPGDINQYQLLEDAELLGSGDVVVFGGRHDTGGTFLLDSFNSSSKYFNSTSVEEDMNLISIKEENSFIVEKVIESGQIKFAFKNDSGYLYDNHSSQSIGYQKDQFLWNISITDGKALMEVESEYHLGFNYNGGTTPRFKYYSSISSIKELRIYKIASQIEIDTWAKTFVETTEGCTNLDKWSILGTSYGNLSSEAKNIFVNSVAIQEEEAQWSARAAARYDYLLSDPRFSADLTPFAERSASSNRPNPIFVFNESNTLTIVIVLLCIGGTSAICGYYIYTKKKQKGV